MFIVQKSSRDHIALGVYGRHLVIVSLNLTRCKGDLLLGSPIGENELLSKTELSTKAYTELSSKKVRGFWSAELSSNTELSSNERTELSSINNY